MVKTTKKKAPEPIKFDAMQRQAMRVAESGGLVVSASIIAVLREIHEKHPKLLVLRTMHDKSGVVASLTGLGKLALAGKSPPSGRSVPDNERQARYKAKLVQSGGRRTSINFTPETMGFIISIRHHRRDLTISQIVADAVRILAQQVHNKAAA